MSSGWLMNLWYCSMSFGWDNIIWSVSHPDVLPIGSIWSGWLMVNVLTVLCYLYDITKVEPYVIRMRELLVASHPEDVWPIRDVIRMTYEVVLCHRNEITNLIPKSSEWLNYSQYLIQITYVHCRVSSGWLTMLPYVIRMRWLCWSLSHPDDLAILSISSGWFMGIAWCHPDDLHCYPMSPRWDNWSGWLSNWQVCHPDDLWPV